MRNFIFILYRALLFLAFPAVLLYLALRAARSRPYWLSLGERFGRLPSSIQQTGSGAIWLHAVSVGEVLTSVKMLKTLREQIPDARLYVSTSTTAGCTLAHEKLPGLCDGIFYAPLDFAFAVRGTFRRLRPRVLIVQETEIWPNLWHEAKRHGTALIVVNARISDKAFPKYERHRWFFRHIVTLPDLILAQSQISLDRYRALGAPKENTALGGNLKYDFDPFSSAPPAVVTQAIQDAKRIWIAASTMPGEPDEVDAVLAAFQHLAKSHSGLLLILAPRKPERFDEAAAKLEAAQIPFARRTWLREGDRVNTPGALLLDSIGELSALFPYGHAVFIGGTIVPWGGHNILEPAFHAKPIVIGPHMHNFPEIAEEFRDAGAIVTIKDPAELGPAIERLLDNPGDIGERARRLAESKRGATANSVNAVANLYRDTVPCRPHSLLAQILLGPLAALWSAGARARRARQLRNAETLPVPVISVGGIGMGGAGKTPFALWLAARLENPAFLTRGYRRLSLDPVLVLAPGATALPAQTGDEAQLLLHSALGPVAISANRHLAGLQLLKNYKPDVFILDDGFQHWRLRRNADLVMIDALDPFHGDALFPLGRLRESLQALARASAIVITRSSAHWPGLEGELRRYSQAPIFYSRVVPMQWRKWNSTESLPPLAMAEQRVSAFCGLGNPASFWTSLAEIGIRPIRRWAYGDHHRYRPREMRLLAHQTRSAGGKVLLTTPKDVQNLPPDAAGLVEPLEIWWLEIGIEVERETELLALVRSYTEPRA